MTKQDFVDAVAGKSGLSKRDAGAAVDAFLETVEETLKSGDSVTFTGFGKFHTTHRAARMAVSRKRVYGLAETGYGRAPVKLVAARAVSDIDTLGKVGWYARRTAHNLVGLVS